MARASGGFGPIRKPFRGHVTLPTIQAQCPKGHVLNVTYHQGEKDITFRCPHCKADYRLKLPDKGK